MNYYFNFIAFCILCQRFNFYKKQKSEKVKMFNILNTKYYLFY